MNGKGDKKRKRTVSQEVWSKNWENIFGTEVNYPPAKSRPNSYENISKLPRTKK